MRDDVSEAWEGWGEKGEAGGYAKKKNARGEKKKNAESGNKFPWHVTGKLPRRVAMVTKIRVAKQAKLYF